MEAEDEAYHEHAIAVLVSVFLIMMGYWGYQTGYHLPGFVLIAIGLIVMAIALVSIFRQVS
jgi:hypothetical protein